MLCGGLGTRLRTVVADRPKPMAEVGGRPFLDFLIERTAAQGLRRFILCSGHRAETVRAHFTGRRDVEVAFSEEPAPLGTAGALKLAERHIATDPFLVLNGDSYCPLDLGALLAFHSGTGAAATVAAAPAAGRVDGGALTLGPAGEVLKFAEKSGGDRINAGVYACGHHLLSAIPPGKACSLEKDVFPGLGKALYGFPVEEPVYDIGTPERLEAFRKAFA